MNKPDTLLIRLPLCLESDLVPGLSRDPIMQNLTFNATVKVLSKVGFLRSIHSLCKRSRGGERVGKQGKMGERSIRDFAICITAL